MQTTDKEVELAKQSILQLFTDKVGRPKKTPYHVTQLQTLLENDFFPWVTYQAAKQLVENEKVLSRLETSTKTQEKVVFFYNSKLDKPEYRQQLTKHVKSHCQLID